MDEETLKLIEDELEFLRSALARVSSEISNGPRDLMGVSMALARLETSVKGSVLRVSVFMDSHRKGK